MRAAEIHITAEDIIAAVPGSVRRTPAAIAIARHVPQGVGVIDNGPDVSYRLPSGNWLGDVLPGEARDLDVFYTGRDTVRPVTFTLRVPDEADAGLEVAA